MLTYVQISSQASILGRTRMESGTTLTEAGITISDLRLSGSPPTIGSYKVRASAGPRSQGVCADRHEDFVLPSSERLTNTGLSPQAREISLHSTASTLAPVD